MKKIFFVFLIIPVILFATVDERKTDVYFANGILTKEETAYSNAGILEDAIKNKYGIDYYNKYIGKVDYAYNSTHDMFTDKDGWFDLIESYFQKTNFQELLDNWRATKSLGMIQTAINKWETIC